MRWPFDEKLFRRRRHLWLLVLLFPLQALFYVPEEEPRIEGPFGVGWGNRGNVHRSYTTAVRLPTWMLSFGILGLGDRTHKSIPLSEAGSTVKLVLGDASGRSPPSRRPTW
jgi:hypothetical protein